MAKVLIIDDDAAIALMLEKMIKNIDHEAEYELTLEKGLQKAHSGDHDVIFLDVHMPDGNGLEALKELRAMPDSPEVIIMTGLGDPDGAEIAIKNGAWDYIQKPLSPKKIILPINRVLQYRDNLRAFNQPPPVLKKEGLIGNDVNFEVSLKQLAMAAAGDANVLITGETGTGKELFAKTLHANSKLKDRSLVVVDCGALPETLVESSLFGHEKGAFTGANHAKRGLIRMADQGTLFLDEVCELSLPLQKAFLRVLQEKTFRPLGSPVEVTSNFRLVAATNQDPEAMVRQGLFRKDLLYRLRAINIHIPPLRERVEDIGALLFFYTGRITRRLGCSQKGFSPEFIDVLKNYAWPGNVRELVNALESAITAANQEPILFPTHLPEQLRIALARASVQGLDSGPPQTLPPQTMPLPPLPGIGTHLQAYKTFREDVLTGAEKVYFKTLLERTGNSIKDACQVSGLGRTRLYTLLKKHGIGKT